MAAAIPPTSTVSDPLAFVQFLVSLVEDGRRSATYKLAVVLGLLDCCLALTDGAARAPSTITTRQLARAVIAAYWSQVRPYPLVNADDVVLRQSSGGKAITVEAVRELREVAEAVGAGSFQQADVVAPEALERCVDVVELNLVRMPLGKLQRPGTYSDAFDTYPRFLYDDSAFHEGITRAQLDRNPMTIRLQPQVGDWLVSLNGILRPLVELQWTRAVAKYNAEVVGQDRLRKFLFGATRIGLQRIVSGLRAAQDGLCFYCSLEIGVQDVEVDHFIPWSKMPNDGLANLVVADRRCNNSKRDRLPSIPLLLAWAARPVDVLAEIATQAQWPLSAPESRQIARAIYAHLPPKSPLWAGRSEVVLAESADLAAAVEALASN